MNDFTSTEIAGHKMPGIAADAFNATAAKNTPARRAKLKNLRIALITATLCRISAFHPEDSTKSHHRQNVFAGQRGLAHLQANDTLMSFFDFVWELAGVQLSDSSG